jgi:hypothetical protein
MYISSVRARISNDPAAALAWAESIAKYVQKKTGTEVQAFARVGATHDVVWLQQHASLAEFEKVREQLQSDREYWGYIKDAQAKGLFDTPNIEEGLWRRL